MSPGLLACDVSEFQVPVDDGYPHGWLIFRVCDGTYQDHKFAANYRWATAAAKAGKIAGFTVYCVYRPGVNTLGTVKAMVGTPDPRMTVMIDVESWGSAIRGNHAREINRLATDLAAWLGDRRRVIAYGNQNDLKNIYPARLVGGRARWIKLMVASYGSVQPSVKNMIGWQYSDGQAQWPVPAGLPRASAPFGHCDHNIFPGLTPTQLATLLGVAPPPTSHTEPPPPPVSGLENDDMPLIVYVDRADCVKQNVRWPGIFLLTGSTLAHVATTADVTSLKKAGVKQAVVSLTTYRNLGGK